MDNKDKKPHPLLTKITCFTGMILCVAVVLMVYKKQFMNVLHLEPDMKALKDSLFVKSPQYRVLYGIEKGILEQNITTLHQKVTSVQYFSDYGRIKSLVSSYSSGKGKSAISIKSEVLTRHDSVFLINFEDKTIRLKLAASTNSLFYLDYDNLSRPAMDSLGITYLGNITYLNHSCSHFKENNRKIHLSGDLYVYKNMVLFSDINNNNLLTKIETISLKEGNPSSGAFLLPSGFSMVDNNCN
jgi:hypothetical protein